jgi:hypothetical protein
MPGQKSNETCTDPGNIVEWSFQQFKPIETVNPVFCGLV